MKGKERLVSALVVSTSIVVSSFLIFQTVFANSVTSQVIVGASAPVVSSVSVNGGTTITLTSATTTPINVVATITDANGCGEINTGTTTVLLYRSGVSSSTCATTPNSLNCYIATAFTASSTCSGGIQTATTTFNLQYFAQATDASSSFSGQTWLATVNYRTPDAATGTADSAGVTLGTLTAINVPVGSINYGTITANTNTGSTNQLTPVTNAGNSSSSLQLSILTTLTSGANVIPTTTSQTYFTAPFTWQGSSVFATAAATTVGAFTLLSPTTTANATGTIYWGLAVPNATPTGTYSGTNVFTALWHA